ncbi:DUF924 family protein [Phenylobacterium sp.]|uniref:DUF924 family protein n=1 Tax=Phenylobacterium sp. TaxID=1871053 RepID=UPI00286B566C|nr:DUF924 family protein [Phenylobacterium sp.]
MAATPHDVTGFWRTAGPQKWYAKNAKFDDAIALKFEPVHHAAARGEYDGWAASAEGALALLILLDQFPRNLFRGSPHAFATDGKARQVARTAVNAGFDRVVEPELRQFFYMPLEHSEDLADQDEAVRLFTLVKDETGDAESLKWANLHRDIIVRFGRFPHRNASLGRVSTPAELAFLEEGGFAG